MRSAIRKQNYEKGTRLVSKLSITCPTEYYQMTTTGFGIFPNYATDDKTSEYWESEDYCNKIVEITDCLGYVISQENLRVKFIDEHKYVTYLGDVVTIVEHDRGEILNELILTTTELLLITISTN